MKCCIIHFLKSSEPSPDYFLIRCCPPRNTQWFCAETGEKILLGLNFGSFSFHHLLSQKDPLWGGGGALLWVPWPICWGSRFSPPPKKKEGPRVQHQPSLLLSFQLTHSVKSMPKAPSTWHRTEATAAGHALPSQPFQVSKQRNLVSNGHSKQGWRPVPRGAQSAGSSGFGSEGFPAGHANSLRGPTTSIAGYPAVSPPPVANFPKSHRITPGLGGSVSTLETRREMVAA